MAGPWYYQALHGYTGIIFVGCVHTVTPELTARLNRVLEYANAFENFALVFGGDLSSSKLLDNMKVHFYNIKRGQGGELERFMELVNRNGGLNRIASQADWFDTVKSEEYIGPWVGKYASDTCRKAIEQGFVDNTAAICEMAQKFRDKGARVMVCGGNWEDVQNSRTTMGMPDIPDHVPVLREMGVEVFTEIEYVCVGNVDLVFIPYWELAKYNVAETPFRLGQAISECALKNMHARIAVAHAEPNWAVHNRMNPTVSPERAEIIKHLDFCLAGLRPHQVVYPHQHDPIKSVDGHVLGDNAKYLMHIEGRTVKLVEDAQTVQRPSKDIIAVSYIPFQKVGFLSTDESENQAPEIMGGQGKLIEVLSI